MHKGKRKTVEMILLVYGGEVDCFETNGGKEKYVELKTSREIETPNQDRNFRRSGKHNPFRGSFFA